MLLCTWLIVQLGFTGSYAAAAVSETDPEKITKDAAAPEKELSFNDVVVTDAIREFKSLSRTDRKARVAEAKMMIKEYKAAKKAGSETGTSTVLLAILAILLPPLAVYLKEGIISGKFWLSLVLTLLFWIPGVIYALIVVLS
jgi:uncharacterized membrane protein YqaE (UPF0057 family)